MCVLVVLHHMPAPLPPPRRHVSARTPRSHHAAGLIVLSDDMAASMIKGLPESLLLVKA